MFGGCMTALVTPMRPDGSIDEEALRKNVARQIAAGVSAVVVNGTTGEAPTLSHDEQQAIIRVVVEEAGHRVPVVAGTGSYATREAIERGREAMRLGADACLIVTPYYNKPSQEGLYQHYKAIAEAVPLPIILYNVPGRTGCDLLPQTVARLSAIPNIVGLKECVLTIGRIEALLDASAGRLDLLSGNDEETLGALRLGFKGVISVASNIAPRLVQGYVQAALAGNVSLAHEIHARLSGLHAKLFVEGNPVPCKFLMHDMGLISSGIRLPLVPLAEKYHQELREALLQAGDHLC